MYGYPDPRRIRQLGGRVNEVGIKIIGAFEIGKLQLQNGDVLVVKTDRPMSQDVTERVRKHLKSLLPQGITIMIIDRGVELSVLTKAEIDERVA
jgi:hypothetical protein